jgi:hypothetical protein
MIFTPTKKDWFKFITGITDPFYLEAIITEAEARRRQLKSLFKPQTPRD